MTKYKCLSAIYSFFQPTTKGILFFDLLTLPRDNESVQCPMSHFKNSFPFQVSLPRFLETENHPKLETLQDFRILLDRARKIPRQLDQIIELLQQGIKEDVTFPRESLTRYWKRLIIIEKGWLLLKKVYYYWKRLIIIEKS